MVFFKTLNLDRIARNIPFIMLGYLALQLLIRLLLSSNLENDEAQFVGNIYFALGYGNSHPPLYNWIIGVFYRLTGYWPLAVALPKHLMLAATYILTFDTVRRTTQSHLAAAAAVVVLVLMPHVLWVSQVTLAHTVMVMAAVAATLHAMTLVLQSGRRGAFVWLGIAIVAGLLTKYIYVLFLLSLLVAAVLVPDVRKKLFTRRFLISCAVVVAAFLPHALWLANHFAVSTERLARFQDISARFSRFDLPLIGIDGFLSLCGGLLTSVGLAAGVWFVVRRLHSHPAERYDASELSISLRRLTGLILVLGFAAASILVLISDAHSVRERYLTPQLMALPIWLVLAFPLHHARKAMVRLFLIGGIAIVLVTLAWPQVVLLAKHRLSYPFKEFAQQLAGVESQNFAILGSRYDYTANLVLRIPGTQVWQPGSNVQKVLVVTRDDEVAPQDLERQLGPAYLPSSPQIMLTAPYYYFSGKQATAQAQFFMLRTAALPSMQE